MGIREKPTGPRAARESEPVSASVPDYGDGRFSLANSPIYLRGIKKISFTPESEEDMGLAYYFNERKEKARDTEIHNEAGEIEFCIFDKYNLSNLINHSSSNEETILEDKGLAALLPAPGSGIVPIGRGGRNIPSYEEFRDNKKFKRSCEEFVSLLESNKDYLGVFSTAYKNVTRKRFDLSTFQSDMETKSGRLVLMHILPEFLFSHYVPTLAPGEWTHKQTTKMLDLDFFADASISGFRKGSDGIWKTNGFFYVVEKNGVQSLYFADPDSTRGYDVRIAGRNASEIADDLEKNLALDEKHGTLKRIPSGIKPPRKCIRKNEDGTVSVDMTQKYNSKGELALEEICATNTVKLFDLNPENECWASIGLGKVDSKLNLQKNWLVLYQNL